MKDKVIENSKPYTQQAHELLKVLGYYVYLRETNPSNYDEYHEVTRKFLEGLKKE